MLEGAQPFLLVLFLRFLTAGMSIIAKFAMNQGMNLRVFIVYRYLCAAAVVAPFALVLERKSRPKMTLPVFLHIMVLGLLEPMIGQNLYYTGLKYTSATFAAAMCNILPAFTFLLAWIFRQEIVTVTRVHSQAKILGTVVTVAGAMMMTLVKGPAIWAESASEGQGLVNAAASSSDPIKGALMIVSSCFCYACFIILQANTLKLYPAELSLTTLICLVGSLEGFIPAIAFERGINASSWTLHFDVTLLAIIYSGVICTGVAYYIQSKVIQARGPVFLTIFTPLSMIIVAILGSLFLHEIVHLGRLFGALVIVVGLYLVQWGKRKDETPSVQNDEHTQEIHASSNGSVEMNSFVVAPVEKHNQIHEAV